MIVLTEFNTNQSYPSNTGPNMMMNFPQQQMQYQPNLIQPQQQPQQMQTMVGLPQQNFTQQPNYYNTQQNSNQYQPQNYNPQQYQQQNLNIQQQPASIQSASSNEVDTPVEPQKKSFKQSVNDLMQKKWARNAAIGASVLGGLGLAYGGYKTGMFDHLTGAIAGNVDEQPPIEQKPTTQVDNPDKKSPVVHDVQPDLKAIPEGPPPQQHIPLRQIPNSHNNPVYVDHSHAPRQSIMLPDNGRMPYNYQYHGERPFDRITGQRIMRIPGYSF